MKDIARALGLSQSTVSRVLSGAPSAVPIADATRERVVAEARRRGYRPNPLASGLRGARTRLLGVIMGEIIGPWGVAAIDAVTNEASARGYNTVLGNAHGHTDEALAIRDVLETRHCDAIIVIGNTQDQVRLLEELRDTTLPLVAWGQGLHVPGVCVVDVDNEAGVTLMLEHLAELGHRRIAFVGGTSESGGFATRKAAFRRFVKHLGEDLRDDFVQNVPDSADSGALAVEWLCRQPERPTAIFCATDLLAIGALHAAYRLGLRVPDDISIVGFDDVPLAAYLVPALTTVHMPMGDMARLVVQQALSPEPATDGRAFVIRPTLVVRQSSGPVPR